MADSSRPEEYEGFYYPHQDYYTRIPNDWFLECYGHAKPYYRGHEEPSHGWCKDERICAVPIDKESSEMSNDY